MSFADFVRSTHPLPTSYKIPSIKQRSINNLQPGDRIYYLDPQGEKVFGIFHHYGEEINYNNQLRQAIWCNWDTTFSWRPSNELGWMPIHLCFVEEE